MQTAVVCILCGILPLFSLVWSQGDSRTAADRPTCFRGYTGENSGGSCTFERFEDCDYRKEQGGKNNRNWTMEDRIAKFEPGSGKELERATLRSPPLCERPNIHLCLEIKFMLGSDGGTRFYVELCGSASCTVLYRSSEETKWRRVAIPFNSTGIFEILVVGDKYHDTWFDEASIHLDSVIYRNTSCGEEAKQTMSTSTPSTTQNPIGTGTSTEEGVTSTFRSRDNDQITDWTTDVDMTVMTSTQDMKATGSGESSAYTPESVSVEHRDDNDDDDDSGNSTIILAVAVGVPLLLLLATVVVVVVCARRRRRKAVKKQKDGQSQQTGTRYTRDDSLVMVTNDLYFSMDTARQSLGDIIHETPEQQPTTPLQQQTSDTHGNENPYYSTMNSPNTDAAHNATSSQGDATPTRPEEKTTGNDHRRGESDDNLEKVYENTGVEESKPMLNGTAEAGDEYDELHRDKSIVKARAEAEDTYDKLASGR